MDHSNIIFTARWWCTALIPALGRQRQVDVHEFEAILVYQVTSRTGSKTTEKPCLKQANKQKQKSKNKTNKQKKNFSSLKLAKFFWFSRLISMCISLRSISTIPCIAVKLMTWFDTERMSGKAIGF